MTPVEQREGPEQALDSFIVAINGGDLRAASERLAREACFVTRDSTVIHGRGEVRAALGQLVAMGFRAEVERRTTLTVADIALVSDRWATAVRGESGDDLRQTTRGTAVLASVEGRWKLLVAAPWGWAAGT